MYIEFIPEIYSIVRYLLILIIYYIIVFVDIMIRPLQDEKKDPQSDKYTVILILLFLGNPFFLIASVIERKELIDTYFSIWNQDFISILGILLFSLSGIVMILGRLELGKFGTAKLNIQEWHELIEKGLYKYIRHPIYLGDIISGLAFFIAFNSIIISIIYAILLFIIYNQRANYEEKILLMNFGQNYKDYQKRTKNSILILRFQNFSYHIFKLNLLLKIIIIKKL